MSGEDNNDISDKEHVEYFSKMYADNIGALDKAIFAVSSVAVPLLLNIATKEDNTVLTAKWIILAGIGLFLTVIVLHVIGYRVAATACNDALDKSKNKESRSKFQKAIEIDRWRDGFFICALISIPLAFLIQLISLGV